MQQNQPHLPDNGLYVIVLQSTLDPPVLRTTHVFRQQLYLTKTLETDDNSTVSQAARHDPLPYTTKVHKCILDCNHVCLIMPPPAQSRRGGGIIALEIEYPEKNERRYSVFVWIRLRDCIKPKPKNKAGTVQSIHTCTMKVFPRCEVIYTRSNFVMVYVGTICSRFSTLSEGNETDEMWENTRNHIDRRCHCCNGVRRQVTPQLVRTCRALRLSNRITIERDAHRALSRQNEQRGGKRWFSLSKEHFLASPDPTYKRDIVMFQVYWRRRPRVAKTQPASSACRLWKELSEF